MTYSAHERSHDERLVADLKAARFVEEPVGTGLHISLAHLSGYVAFGDGVMTWSVGGGIGGEKRVDQADIDGSAAYLRAYGRKAVRNNLVKIADEIVAKAEARLAAQ